MTTKGVSGKTGMLCSLEKDLVAVKSLYFFSMSAVGTLFPFAPLLLTHLGLTPSELGLIFSVVPLLAFFKNLLVGFVADKWLCHRYLLVASCVAAAVVNMLFLAVPVQVSPAAGTAASTEQLHIALTCRTNDSHAAPIAACGPLCPEAPAILEQCAYWCVSADRFETQSQSVLPDSATESNGAEVRFCLPSLRQIAQRDHAHQEASCAAGGENASATASPRVVLCRRLSPPAVVVQSTTGYTGTVTFFVSFVLIALSSFCMSNQMLLTDAIVYNILGPVRRHQWGYSRLWGSIGYGASCLLGSALMQLLIDSGSPQRYEPAIYASATLGLAAAALAFVTRAADETAVRCGQTFRHVRQALASARVCLFFVMLLPTSVLNSIWQTYALLSLELRFGASKLVVGVSVLVVTTVEVPMFFIGGRLVKAIGAVPCIYLSLAAFAVRFAGLAYITDRWHVLPLDVLHCFSFTLFYTAASVYSSSVASPSTMAVTQGLVNGTVFGIGLATGAFVGGHVLSVCGFRTLFVGCAVAAGAALLVIAFLHEVIMRNWCPPTPPSTNETAAKAEAEGESCGGGGDEASVAMLDSKGSVRV